LIAFNHTAGARGFQFRAESRGPEGAVMGEKVVRRPGTTLAAESPLPCRFTLVGNGLIVRRQEGPSLEAGAEEPGKYRLGAELNYTGERVPWVYTNPIPLTIEP